MRCCMCTPPHRSFISAVADEMVVWTTLSVPVDEQVLLEGLVHQHVELAVAAVHGLDGPLVVRDGYELPRHDA
eukprot:7388981-Prymnesium_polylepis.1